jgi:hypothetical protein
MTAGIGRKVFQLIVAARLNPTFGGEQSYMLLNACDGGCHTGAIGYAYTGFFEGDKR